MTNIENKAKEAPGKQIINETINDYYSRILEKTCFCSTINLAKSVKYNSFSTTLIGNYF